MAGPAEVAIRATARGRESCMRQYACARCGRRRRAAISQGISIRPAARLHPLLERQRNPEDTAHAGKVACGQRPGVGFHAMARHGQARPEAPSVLVALGERLEHPLGAAVRQPGAMVANVDAGLSVERDGAQADFRVRMRIDTAMEARLRFRTAPVAAPMFTFPNSSAPMAIVAVDTAFCSNVQAVTRELQLLAATSRPPLTGRPGGVLERVQAALSTSARRVSIVAFQAARKGSIAFVPRTDPQWRADVPESRRSPKTADGR